jgi:hypothetical protein
MDFRIGDFIEGDWNRKGKIYKITKRFYYYSSIRGNWFISKSEARLLTNIEILEHQKEQKLYYKIYRYLEMYSSIKEIRENYELQRI